MEVTLRDGAEVLIEDEINNEVGYALACPEGTEIIDLSHLAVTPGMIDAHVQLFHLERRLPGHHFQLGWLPLPDSGNLRSKNAGRRIRTVGWFRGDYIVDVKHAIEEGYITGSRMVVAPHLLSTTGSHGDMTQVVRSNPPLKDYMEKGYPGMETAPTAFPKPCVGK